MKTEIRILLFPVNDYDRKDDVEVIKNVTWTIAELEQLSDKVLDYSLSDFADACNNQEIDLENYWATYINFELTYINFES